MTFRREDAQYKGNLPKYVAHIPVACCQQTRISKVRYLVELIALDMPYVRVYCYGGRANCDHDQPIVPSICGTEQVIDRTDIDLDHPI